MTLKLRRKLQTTIQRITADPHVCFGRQNVCRAAVLFSAVLSAGIAGADTRFVRPVAYQQDPSAAGNVPVVRIDSVQAETQNSVVPVSYTTPAVRSENVNSGGSETSSTVSSSSSNSSLKWVSVNSPEARSMQGRSVSAAVPNAGTAKVSSSALSGIRISGQAVPVSAEEKKNTETLVTPIPAVMPRYSRVRLTSGDDAGLDLDSLGSLDELEIGSVDAEASEAVPAADGEDLADQLLPEAEDASPMMPAGDAEAEVDLSGSETEPLALPGDELDGMPTLNEGMSELDDAQIPGAIGNEEESTLGQGGLKQDTNAPNSGSDVLNTVPSGMPEPSQPEVPSMLPGPEENRELTETFTTRQVDESDYDMPCESSEPMHRITEITNDIELHDTKIVPKSCPLAAPNELFPAREFAGTNVTWTASNLCHNPLYFEQPSLERYGHTIGPLQPVLSGAQFLVTIPYLPMLAAIDPPNECQYSLGYYRPGSCAPRKWSPIPYSTRGAIVEGGVATALVFLIP